VVSFNAVEFACFFTECCTCALTEVMPNNKVSESSSLFRKAIMPYFFIKIKHLKLK
jgi:hypothetical protein